jgi:hypothetical protein
MAIVHVQFTVKQDEDSVWCAHAWLGSSGGANGNGATAEDAVTDLRQAVLMVIEEDGVPAQMEPWPPAWLIRLADGHKPCWAPPGRRLMSVLARDR